MQITREPKITVENSLVVKKNLVGLSEKEIFGFLSGLENSTKKASMRAKQIWSWIYCHGKKNFSEMTNIDKNFRCDLAKNFSIERLNIAKKEISLDGTIKYLFSLKDDSKIETVFIPEKKRGTLCISSQVGCTLNCSFCHRDPKTC